MTATNPAIVDSSRGRDAVVYTGGAATADNDVILELDVTNVYEILFGCTAGTVDVLASIDGTNFLATPLTVFDFGAVGTDSQLTVANECAAGHVCGIKGAFSTLRFLQKGATAVVNFGLSARGR